MAWRQDRAGTEAPEDGETDAVVFYRVDRAVREHIGDFQVVKTSLESCGVQVHFVGTPFDESPEGVFRTDLDMILGRLESRRLGKRLRDVHKRLASVGRWHGGHVPYGLTRTPEGLTID